MILHFRKGVLYYGRANRMRRFEAFGGLFRNSPEAFRKTENRFRRIRKSGEFR